MKETNDFSALFQKKREETEALLFKALPEGTAEEEPLLRAMRYSFFAGGKRIRPIILREIFLLYGGKKEEILVPFMTAIEMIHTYSLIHDDLPAMDNDELRRGRPTNHIVFGEAMAILAGDALLNAAFEQVSEAFSACENLKEFHAVKTAFSILAENAGRHGMITGQVMDMDLSGLEKTKDFLGKMYELKTGALIRASFMIGAALAGMEEEEILRMRQAGEDLGLAFQLRDDILDIEGDPEKLGKKTESDEKNEKLTYLKLLGVEEAREKIRFLTRRVICTLQEINERREAAGFLIEMIESLEHREC